jgi:hypothetical protein
MAKANKKEVDLLDRDLDRVLALIERQKAEDGEAPRSSRSSKKVKTSAQASDAGAGRVPEAKRFMQMLMGNGHLELAGKDALEKLAPQLGQLLGAEVSPGKKAVSISSWLVAQDEVVDLYLDDSALEDLLAVW